MSVRGTPPMMFSDDPLSSAYWSTVEFQAHWLAPVGEVERTVKKKKGARPTIPERTTEVEDDPDATVKDCCLVSSIGKGRGARRRREAVELAMWAGSLVILVIRLHEVKAPATVPVAVEPLVSVYWLARASRVTRISMSGEP